MRRDRVAGHCGPKKADIHGRYIRKTFSACQCVEMTRGERFRHIRELLGPWPGKAMPQARLAAMLDVSERTVRRWEEGESIGGDDLNHLISLVANSGIQGFTLDWLVVGLGNEPIRVWPAQPMRGAGPLTRDDTKYMELDDILRAAGMRAPLFPISNEAACQLLKAAAAELMRIDNEALREELFVEIADWRQRYGCDQST